MSACDRVLKIVNNTSNNRLKSDTCILSVLSCLDHLTSQQCWSDLDTREFHMLSASSREFHLKHDSEVETVRSLTAVSTLRPPSTVLQYESELED